MSCCRLCWVSAKDTFSPGILFRVSGRKLAAHMFVVIVTPGGRLRKCTREDVWLYEWETVFLDSSFYPFVHWFISWTFIENLLYVLHCIWYEKCRDENYRGDHLLFDDWGKVLEISVYQALARYVLTMQLLLILLSSAFWSLLSNEHLLFPLTITFLKYFPGSV